MRKFLFEMAPYAILVFSVILIGGMILFLAQYYDFLSRDYFPFKIFDDLSYLYGWC